MDFTLIQRICTEGKPIEALEKFQETDYNKYNFYLCCENENLAMIEHFIETDRRRFLVFAVYSYLIKRGKTRVLEMILNKYEIRSPQMLFAITRMMFYKGNSLEFANLLSMMESRYQITRNVSVSEIDYRQIHDPVMVQWIRDHYSIDLVDNVNFYYWFQEVTLVLVEQMIQNREDVTILLEKCLKQKEYDVLANIIEKKPIYMKQRFLQCLVANNDWDLFSWYTECVHFEPTPVRDIYRYCNNETDYRIMESLVEMMCRPQNLLPSNDCLNYILSLPQSLELIQKIESRFPEDFPDYLVQKDALFSVYMEFPVFEYLLRKYYPWIAPTMERFWRLWIKNTDRIVDYIDLFMEIYPVFVLDLDPLTLLDLELLDYFLQSPIECLEWIRAMNPCFFEPILLHCLHNHDVLEDVQRLQWFLGFSFPTAEQIMDLGEEICRDGQLESFRFLVENVLDPTQRLPFCDRCIVTSGEFGKTSLIEYIQSLYPGRYKTRIQNGIFEDVRYLKMLPIYSVSIEIFSSKEKIIENREVECVICYDEHPSVVSDCMHTFCRSCIEKWIESKKRSECPYCRSPIVSCFRLKGEKGCSASMQEPESITG